MICSKCGKNEAIYHSVITINGISSEEHLCDKCYGGKSDRFSHFIEECFLSPYDAFDMLLPIECLMDRKCVDTVNNYYKFDSNANYYAKYQNILEEAKKSVSKGVKKVCEERKQNSNFDIIQKLKIELAEAVSIEDYERAAELKKQIEKLSKENNDAK